MSQRFMKNRKRYAALIDHNMTHAPNTTLVNWRNESADGPIECEAVPLERPVDAKSQPRSNSVRWLPALLLVCLGALAALLALVGITLLTFTGQMLGSLSRPFRRNAGGGRPERTQLTRR